jgi:predicted ester cyclase
MDTPREIAERSIVLYNSGALEELVSMYADDAVEITPAGNNTGREAILKRVRGDRVAFPDKRLTLQHLTVDDKTAVMECEFVGTHTGPWRMLDGTELPPTGQQVTFSVVIAADIRDGQVTQTRMYFDQLPLLAQLGLVALPG